MISTARRPRPLGRIEVEVRDDGQIWALGAAGVMSMPSRPGRTSSAVLVYVIMLVAFQVFLITVAVEAFQTDDESLAWATATVSVISVAGPALFLRYLRP